MNESRIQAFYDTFWRGAARDPKYAHYDVRGRHIPYFTRQTLPRLLTAKGFEVMQMEGIGRARLLWMSHWIVAYKRTRTSTLS